MAKTKTAENIKSKTRVAAGPSAPGLARSLGETAGIALRPIVPLGVMVFSYGMISWLLWRPLNGAQGNTVSDGLNSAEKARLGKDIIRQALLSQNRPPWISREDFEQTANCGLAATGHSVFEADLSRKLAHTYEGNYWVEQVRQVKLRYPARMELELEFRKPAARLERGVVLDHQGVLLNLMADSPVVKDLPLITGVQCSAIRAGQTVPESECQDGLHLLEVVRSALFQSPGKLSITSLMRDKTGHWKVQTSNGGPMIYWGVFSEEPPVDEPRTREKADLLRRRLCEIKDPSLLEYVKVYTSQAPVKPRQLYGANDTVIDTSGKTGTGTTTSGVVATPKTDAPKPKPATLPGINRPGQDPALPATHVSTGSSGAKSGVLKTTAPVKKN